MPAILAKIWNLIGPVFLNWAWGKVSSWLAQVKKAQEDKAKSEAENKAVREKTQAADTKEQREEAAKDVIKNV